MQQTSFWNKASISFINLHQKFWYMACNKRNKSIDTEFEKSFTCIYLQTSQCYCYANVISLTHFYILLNNVSNIVINYLTNSLLLNILMFLLIWNYFLLI